MSITRDTNKSEKDARGPWLDGWYMLAPILCLSFARDLWAPDEPRYAQVAREAFEADHLLVMHLNGALYPDKPPLLYWLSGACGALGGWHAFALRIPSILATIGSAYLCARLARRWFGRLEARWAALFYLGTAMVTEIGGRLQIDPLLSFLCLLALVLATDERDDGRRRVRSLWLGGAALGFAALAKGPPAWVHVALVLATWRCLPFPARVSLAHSARAWLGFVALAVLPVLVWATAASIAEPRLFRPLFYGQHMGRVAEGTQHAGPPWYHLAHLPYLLLPWTPLFALALARALRTLVARYRGSYTVVHGDAGVWRAASWFCAILLFFSIITPKRDLYILPLYPAAALLCAREIAHAQRRGGLARSVRASVPALLLVAALGVSASPFLATDVAPYRTAAFAVGGCLAAGATGAWVWRGEPRRWAQATSAGFALAVIAFAVLGVPRFNVEKSARGLALYLASRPQRPLSIPCVGVQPEGYRFYGRVPATKEELWPALERDGDQFLALIAEKHFRALSAEERARVRVLERRGVGSRDILVLGSSAPRQEHPEARASGR